MRDLIRGVCLGALPLLLASAPAGAQAAASGARPAAAPATAKAAPVPPLDSVVTRAARSRMLGKQEAPLLIYVFSDFQCPFCREFETGTFPAIDSAYVRTGKARVVFLNFPLNIHPHSWVGAEAAMCAGAQGKFWPMHDTLFAEQKQWVDAAEPETVFERYAANLGLNLQEFRTCTRDDQPATLLIRDLTAGASGGVQGTPTIVVLREPKKGEEPKDVQRIFTGAVSFSQFREAADELLKGAAGKP
ncbi:MAG TPA: thioredoxin domain-containing protein [Longimicrobiaceae bacterium]|nr:thioredoxin domain-containing protein [Longimicrobiaceae bacterium]